MLNFEGRYVDPMELERYYNVMDNYIPVHRDVFIKDVQSDFPLFYRVVNYVVPISDLKKPQEGPPSSPETANLPGRELMIRKEDLRRYRRLVGSMWTAVDEPGGGNNRRGERKALLLKELSKVVLKDFLDDPISSENLENLHAISKLIVKFVLKNDEVFYSLLSEPTRDFYTYVHSTNVSVLAVGLGLVIGLSRSPDLELLALGGLLHDIGKCRVDLRIVNKPGKLSLPEFLKIKCHVRYGLELLTENHYLPEKVLTMVAQHHERLSGNGYPLGLKDNQISQCGRIAAIADTFDILTTNRTYKEALPTFEALNVLSMSQGDFDQKLLLAFTNLLGSRQ
jgi:putative nucleotidyltransferase with HDIG domain